MPIRISIIYSQADQSRRDELRKQLTTMERKGIIEVWDRSNIPPGSQVQQALERALSQADILVLLLSPDLLANDDVDVQIALQQQKRGARIIPVLLRSVFLESDLFENLTILPRDSKGKAISQYSDPDGAWVQVVGEIVKLARSLIKLLVLVAQPTNASALALLKEADEIKTRIKDDPRDRYMFALEQATTVADLTRLLLRTQPTLLHFSGHGAPDGRIVLLDPLGKGQPVPPASIAEAFSAFKARGLRGVVLNACFSDELAKALAEHIEFAVGVEGTIPDQSAVAFSAGFYTALANNCSLEEAFRLGKVQIGLQDQQGAPLHLYVQPGVDPATFKLR